MEEEFPLDILSHVCSYIYPYDGQTTQTIGIAQLSIINKTYTFLTTKRERALNLDI